MIKDISLEVKGNAIRFAPPDRKTIILKGQNSTQIMYVLESLLLRDVSGYYSKPDEQHGYSYEPLTGLSSITFDGNRSIMGKGRVIKTYGELPNLHVIRYLSGSMFRSFYFDSKLEGDNKNLTRYSDALQDTQWFRVIAMTNKILGFEFVSLQNKELKFYPDDGNLISVDGQKLVYLLIAECFTTKERYSRVLLLPNLNVLPVSLHLNFLRQLSGIDKHSVTFVGTDIKISDINARDSIAILNI